MAELVLGDPQALSSDIGPVIDGEAQHAIKQHIADLETRAKCIEKASIHSKPVSYTHLTLPTILLV